jgi:AraC-like DNA-binding protein
MSQQLMIEETVPFIHNAGEVNHRQGSKFFKAMHNHPDSTEVLLICEGRGKYNIGGVSYDVKPYSIVIYNKGIWHEESAINDKKHTMKYIAFSNVKVKGLDADCLISESRNPIFYPENFFEFRELFDGIIKENRLKGSDSQWIARHLTGVLIGRILRSINNGNAIDKQSNAVKVVEEAKHYIQENYYQNITLEDLASATYLSPYYLSHLFKEKVKVSPIQYLIQYRIEVAKHLLLTTNLTISEIAIKVGYQSETHFQNTFKRAVERTPGQYRNM